jgi:hypothetical protein
MTWKPIKLLREWRTAGESGSATVEFVMVAPVLVALAIGIADFGVLMNSVSALTSGSRAGAGYVKSHPAAINSDLTSFFPTGATPSISSPICTCVDNTTTSCGPSGTDGWFSCPGAGDANPCASGHGSDTRVLRYVPVSGNQTFTPILPVTNLLFFGSSSSSSLTATTCLRVQ